MTEQNVSPQGQVEAASKAFEQEFERFARFTGDPSALTGIDLETAISEERALADLRTRHLGKKSALAATKKLIGHVAPEERAAFGQLVQSAEAATAMFAGASGAPSPTTSTTWNATATAVQPSQLASA